MKLSLDYLKTFYYCCKYESLSKAAKYLNLSNSGVSSQIATLEKELSVKLMIRNKAGVQLTPDGKMLLKHACEIIPKVNTIPEYFQSPQKREEGEITIITLSGIGVHIITKHIKNFVKSYPKIKIIVKCIGSNASMEDQIADVMISPHISNRPDLKQIELFNVKFYLYASREYLSTHGTPNTIEDLEKHILVSAYDNIENLYKNTDWHLSVNTLETRNPTYVINSSSGVLEATKNDLGIGAIPSYLNPEEHGLIRILKNITPPINTFYFTYPLHLINIRRIEILKEHLISVCKKIS